MKYLKHLFILFFIISLSLMSGIASAIDEKLVGESQWFDAGKYQKWAWCGTTCWVIVNPVDKEIMLIDGYVSKGTLGDQANFNYTGHRGLNRIVRLANFLRFLKEDYFFTIVGLITLHRHGDHAGDIGTLLWALRADTGQYLDDNEFGFNRSTIPLEYTSIADKFPIIGDRDAVESPLSAQGYPVKEFMLMTHRIQFKNDAGNDIADSFKEPVKFASKADLIRVRPFEKRIVCETCTAGAFKLGHFEVQPYVWDHMTLPPVFQANVKFPSYRTLALRIWRDNASDARRVFITGSRGEAEGHTNKVPKIWTDHLIYAWGNNDEINLTYRHDEAAKIARDTIRFYERNSTSSILGHHHDPNECEITNPTCPRNNHHVDKMIAKMKTIQPVAIIDDGQSCARWHTSTNQCIQVVKFSNRIGFNNVDWSQPFINKLDCDRYCKTLRDCACFANSCSTNQTTLATFDSGTGADYKACYSTAQQQCTSFCDGDPDCDTCTSNTSCPFGHTLIQTFSDSIGDNYLACRRPDFGLTLKHYVNEKNADTPAKPVTVNGGEIEVLYRVENIGRFPLFKVRTYFRAGHPILPPVLTGHWQQECTMGELHSGEVRYCKTHYRFSGAPSGLYKVIGIAQGLKRTNFSRLKPVTKEDQVRATNPTFFYLR